MNQKTPLFHLIILAFLLCNACQEQNSFNSIPESDIDNQVPSLGGTTTGNPAPFLTLPEDLWMSQKEKMFHEDFLEKNELAEGTTQPTRIDLAKRDAIKNYNRTLQERLNSDRIFRQLLKQLHQHYSNLTDFKILTTEQRHQFSFELPNETIDFVTSIQWDKDESDQIHIQLFTTQNTELAFLTYDFLMSDGVIQSGSADFNQKSLESLQSPLFDNEIEKTNSLHFEFTKTEEDKMAYHIQIKNAADQIRQLFFEYKPKNFNTVFASKEGHDTNKLTRYHDELDEENLCINLSSILPQTTLNSGTIAMQGASNQVSATDRTIDFNCHIPEFYWDLIGI